MHLMCPYCDSTLDPLTGRCPNCDGFAEEGLTELQGVVDECDDAFERDIELAESYLPPDDI